jgi:hypothetical protein
MSAIHKKTVIKNFPNGIKSPYLRNYKVGGTNSTHGGKKKYKGF